ncbi:MAG: methionine--tRNA ligase [bacterium]|nr:methionine--tRNA ligase [bacterium]
MKNKLYITTAIPYANGAPHIGNALDYLLADIWARHQRSKGLEVRFQVGTDEHGNKIAEKALQQNLTPQAYVDGTVENFRALMDKMKTTYTDFVRTTDSHHIGASQYIWTQLGNFIYKNSYEGWYCKGCESFYTEKEVAEQGGVCRDHQIPFERLSEENYYLRISEFAPKIIEAIESDKMKIVPEYRKKEFLNFLRGGLEDVSISRPKKNLTWGVPVPSDPDQVMYVWIDALANYLSVIGYPDRLEWQEFWPANVQVIGKDILRFHAGIWPAMLLGLGLPLPKTLLVHGHISSGGVKMSKSIGNVVSPNEIIDNYGLDAFRYYFSRHIPTLDDGDFTWEKFEKSYNNELGNDLGNLVSRVANMIKRYQSGVIGEIKGDEFDLHNYEKHMKDLEFNKAMDEVWTLVRAHNQYIENVKPWEIAKLARDSKDEENHLAEVLAHSAGGILQIGRMLAPFMPDTAEKIETMFASGVIRDEEIGILFPKIYIKTEDPRVKK